jgi:hypothetical protein
MDGKFLKIQPALTAFIFVGIGNARHFYATLTTIARHEQKVSGAKNQRYHFTLVDLKASALARDLIFFWLLDELSQSNDSTARNIVVAMYFILIGTIMPSGAYKKLQSTITKVIDALQNAAQVPDWLFVPKTHRTALVKHLKYWQNSKAQKITSRSMRIETEISTPN